MNNNYFLWIDIETTGLRPRYNAILEIAAIVTDFELNRLGTFHQVFRSSPMIRSSSSEVVKKMHDDNGLWAETYQAEYGPWESSSALKEFIDVHCGEAKPVPAGSSIHFDMGFIQVQMPRVADRVHYRMFDARTLQIAMEQWYRLPEFPRLDTHRAMDDIEQTLGHVKTIKALLEAKQQHGTQPSTWNGFT